MTPPFANSYWLEPNRILCGEYPRDFDDVGDHQGMTAVLAADQLPVRATSRVPVPR